MHQRGFPLARILGIQVRIDYSWFFIFFLLLWILAQVHLPAEAPGQPAVYRWLAGLVGSLLFFGSVLAHEMSHSLVARALGVRVLGITLFLFGGVSTLASEPEDGWSEIKIAAAGPLMSFFLAAGFFPFGYLMTVNGTGYPLVAATLVYLGLANLVLGVFNLLPGFPLDGGRVLRAIWWLRTGSPLRATRAASRGGRIVAVILMGLGGLQLFFGAGIQGLWLILIGLFLRAAAVSAYRGLEMRELLQGVRVEDVLESLPPAIPAGTSVAVAAREYFLRYGSDGFPVVRDARIQGFVELSRIRQVPQDRQETVCVEEIQASLSGLPVVSWRGLLSRALSVMTETGRRSVVAVDDEGQPVGRVTKEGVERFLRNRRELALERGSSGS